MTQLHVFTYSERPGTQALKIEYVVSPEEKHRRSQRLLVLSDEKTKAFYTSHIGKEAWVLMENLRLALLCMDLLIIISGWRWTTMINWIIS